MDLFQGFAEQIAALDDGYGVRVFVEGLDGKCAYSMELDHEQADAMVGAIVYRWDVKHAVKQRDEARAKEDAGIRALVLAQQGIDRLTKERDAARVDLHVAKETQANLRNEKAALAKQATELRAAVEQMTTGVPAVYAIIVQDKVVGGFADKVRTEQVAKESWINYTIAPLFTATQPSPQAAELAARVETIGKAYEAEKLAHGETMKHLADRNADLSAAKARVDTLTAGERLTKDALAAAEKRAAKAESDCGEWKGRAITAKTDRDEALAAYEKARRARDVAEESEATTAKAHADLVAAAEATRERLMTLGRITEDERDHFAGLLATALGKLWTKLPGAPKLAGEPVAWRIEYGPSDYGHTDSAERVARAKGQDAKITPLYEAPPVGVDVSEIRTLIEHGKQGCFDLSSFLIVLGNMLGELPTVDVAAIRTVIADLRECFPTQTGEQSARILLTAIGGG